MLLDQLQTDYRDRFIRLEYVWALKYSPTQARDKDGQWIKGGVGLKLPEAPMTSRLRTFWAETTNPLETGFLLYDGTRIHKRPEVTHAEMAAGPRGRLQYRPGNEQLADLFVLLDENVIRYVPGEGVYLSRKPSEIQAQTIIDDWNTHFPDKPLRVDFVLPGTEGGVASHKEFVGRGMTVDALRHWVHDQQYITAATQRALKFDPTQPRDAKGRWVLDKTGQPLTVYHGSVSPDVTGSKLNPHQPPVRPRSGPNGIYFTSNAQSAYNYIRMPGAGIKGPKGRVIPANIRMNNPLDITDAIKKGQKKGLSFGEAKRKALEDLTPDHDGVIFRGDDYNPDEYIVFSADQIGPVQSIAKKFTAILKYDPTQPRDEQGQWTKTTGRAFTSEEGYSWHEQGPGRKWAMEMNPDDHRALDSYVGFGYRQVNELRRGIQPTREQKIRRLTPEEHKAILGTGESGVDLPVPPEGPGFRYSWSYEHARDTPSGPQKLLDHWAVVGPKVDEERLADVTKQANQLDEMIAQRGLVLDEDIVVERGAYLPGVSVEDLKTLEQYPDDHIWEEKAFTSTFLGDAGGRARSYPALGKWESLHQRYGSGKLMEHQDEVGTAVRFYITLPKGTKVASAEAARRIDMIYPRIQDPSVFEHPEWTADGKLKPEDFTMEDRTQKPTPRTRELDDKGARSESEILLGSGARFRVTKVKKGYTYQTGDATLKPVEVYEVHMEYIGGGSSDGTHHQKAS